jgi:hypothetical protein
MNRWDDIHEAHDRLQTGWGLLKWIAVGPVLIAIGVSQLIFAWGGSSWWMRYGYSSLCILMGTAILGSFCLVLWPQSGEPPGQSRPPED